MSELQIVRWVGFSIASPSIAPDEMSAAVGFQPDERHVIGDPIMTESINETQQIGRGTVEADQNLWVLRVEGSELESIDHLVDAMISRVVPVMEGIRALVDRGCTCTLAIRQDPRAHDYLRSNVHLGAVAIRILGELGASVSVTEEGIPHVGGMLASLDLPRTRT